MNTILRWLSYLITFPFFLVNPVPDYEPSIYVAFAHEIRDETIKELKEKYNLHCVSVAGGMMDSVYLMGLGFELDRPLEKEEARRMVIDCVEFYLSKINQNEKIRPYLKNFPFTEKNIEMAIFPHFPNGLTTYAPLIGVVSSYNGNINFRTYDPDNEYRYKTEEKEPYQEALKIVREEKPTP